MWYHQRNTWWLVSWPKLQSQVVWYRKVLRTVWKLYCPRYFQMFCPFFLCFIQQGKCSAYAPLSAKVEALYSLFFKRALTTQSLYSFSTWRTRGKARRIWYHRCRECPTSEGLESNCGLPREFKGPKHV